MTHKLARSCRMFIFARSIGSTVTSETLNLRHFQTVRTRPNSRRWSVTRGKCSRTRRRISLGATITPNRSAARSPNVYCLFLRSLTRAALNSVFGSVPGDKTSTPTRTSHRVRTSFTIVVETVVSSPKLGCSTLRVMMSSPAESVSNGFHIRRQCPRWSE